MQLKKSSSVRKMLAVATTSLLSGMAHSANSSGDNGWEMDSAILYYSEADRISVIEPVVSLRKDIGDENFLNFRFVLDSLTGSSPNGAIKTSTAQTFTTPSGNSNYTTAANETPLDPTFHDTRGALNAEWEMPLNKTTKAIFGANISAEFDYQSLGVSANISWDFNNRNTTLTTGAAYNADTINPVGGVPTGLTAMSASKSSTGSGDNKQVIDLIIGVTQVINRTTLMQFNLNIGTDSGYMTDPYKILSVLDGSGNLRGTDPYLYEKRPDSRTRQALYWKTVMGFSEDVLNLSYRYYWDDWDVSSHTVEMKYRFSLGNKHYLQPEARYYVQDKANFYYYNLVDGALPTYASADYRLADLKTSTLAFKYGIDMGNDSEFSVRLGKMNQTSNGDASFEDVDATFVQLNYRMVF
ncbi:MAG: DUF3570 domain-containing protein [Gammaproteobacteria bacterium]|nr:DUF3570 domain-containing protein [Gammaproteobacteria bacterium]